MQKMKLVESMRPLGMLTYSVENINAKQSHGDTLKYRVPMHP